MVVSLVCLATQGLLVCKASLGYLGHQVVMALTEPKVATVGQGILHPKNDAKGEPEAQGPASQKWQRGESGTSGIPGTPGVMSYKNWKECAWKDLNGNKDRGLIKVNASFVNQTIDTV